MSLETRLKKMRNGQSTMVGKNVGIEQVEQLRPIDGIFGLESC